MSPEDTNAITLLDPLCTDDAYQRVVAFARRFGEPHTRLAMHAALPLGLTPEIVHLIRINFASAAPLIAEADLLLSPLCREVGRDLYEMFPDVRDLLLEELKSDPEFGPSRVVLIAEFLLAYAEGAIKLTKSPEILDFLRAQQWVALAYARPKDAAQSLALALREGLESANRDETVRIASLTQVLATPLITEEKVLLYAAGVEKLAAGDRAGASRILEAVGPTDQSPRIGDVSLPSPDEVMQMLERSIATHIVAEPVEEPLKVAESVEEPQFDVFLCHNSVDKEAVRKIAEQLKYEYKIEPWLDEWELRPGSPWQSELEKQIAHIKSAAVFVGKSGISPWQENEIYSFLLQFEQRKCRIIPVLLPNAPEQPKLPIFLQDRLGVDFRREHRGVYNAPMVMLVSGITGKKPETIVPLTDAQFKQFHSALLSAFPTQAKLKQMVRFRLGQNLDAIATGENYSLVVFTLIKWAAAEGQLEELLTAALKENPGNLALQKFGEQMLGTSIDEEQSGQDDPSSNKRVDYTRLRDFLKAGNWKKADEETFALMLKVAAREKEGWLDLESIEQFPSNDLRTIDQLWVEYSRARFGFSVQKNIWWAIYGGETEADYERFCERVGWRKRSNKEWRKWAELSFSINALPGHLPAMYGKRLKRGQVVEPTGSRKWLFLSLLSRRDL